MTRTDQGDDRLARLAAGGDQAAFEQIYSRHHQALYRYCVSILRDAEDARDALQNTMEKAFRSMPSQRVKGGLRAWLFTIAHNEAISLAGRREPVAGDALIAAATGPDLQATAANRERLRELVRDLGRLPERQRGALLMREMSGLSYDEVAAALAMSPRVARQTVYEARLALLELGEGRDMGCERVMKKISAGDGRVARGRKIRAHLAECAACTAFHAGIAGRTGDYALVFPALPAVAAAALLQSVTAGAGGGAAAGAAGGSGTAAGGDATARQPGGKVGRAVAAIAVSGLILAFVVASLFGGDEGSTLRSPAPGAPSVAQAASPDRSDPPAQPADVQRGASVEGYSELPGAVLDSMESGGPAVGAGQGGGGDGSGSGLAFTGLDAWMVALLGIAFLALGYALRELAPSRAGSRARS